MDVLSRRQFVLVGGVAGLGLLSGQESGQPRRPV